MDMPKDPAILLSVVNTRLRDFYTSFDDMCTDMELDKAQILQMLSSIGYSYSEERNAFV